MTEAIEQLIRRFFDDAAWNKLECEADGRLFDHDSNWGFDPAALAAQIANLIESERGSGYQKTVQNDG